MPVVPQGHGAGLIGEQVQAAPLAGCDIRAIQPDDTGHVAVQARPPDVEAVGAAPEAELLRRHAARHQQITAEHYLSVPNLERLFAPHPRRGHEEAVRQHAHLAAPVCRGSRPNPGDNVAALDLDGGLGMVFVGQLPELGFRGDGFATGKTADALDIDPAFERRPREVETQPVPVARAVVAGLLLHPAPIGVELHLDPAVPGQVADARTVFVQHPEGVASVPVVVLVCVEHLQIRDQRAVTLDVEQHAHHPGIPGVEVQAVDFHVSVVRAVDHPQRPVHRLVFLAVLNRHFGAGGGVPEVEGPLLAEAARATHYSGLHRGKGGAGAGVGATRGALGGRRATSGVGREGSSLRAGFGSPISALGGLVPVREGHTLRGLGQDAALVCGLGRLLRGSSTRTRFAGLLDSGPGLLAGFFSLLTSGSGVLTGQACAAPGEARLTPGFRRTLPRLCCPLPGGPSMLTCFFGSQSRCLRFLLSILKGVIRVLGCATGFQSCLLRGGETRLRRDAAALRGARLSTGRICRAGGHPRRFGGGLGLGLSRPGAPASILGALASLRGFLTGGLSVPARFPGLLARDAGLPARLRRLLPGEVGAASCLLGLLRRRAVGAHGAESGGFRSLGTAACRARLSRGDGGAFPRCFCAGSGTAGFFTGRAVSTDGPQAGRLSALGTSGGGVCAAARLRCAFTGGGSTRPSGPGSSLRSLARLLGVCEAGTGFQGTPLGSLGVAQGVIGPAARLGCTSRCGLGTAPRRFPRPLSPLPCARGPVIGSLGSEAALLGGGGAGPGPDPLGDVLYQDAGDVGDAP